MNKENHQVCNKPSPASRTLVCRDKTLTIGERTLIMGIINVTPDSFSDGGETATVESAVARAQQMVEEGADLLDIGGESTRPGSFYPGSQPISLDEELKRVIPVIEAVEKCNLGVPISIDTYKAEVARQALEAGADIVNDVWRLTKDPNMASVVARYQCPVILMHNRTNMDYQHFLQDVKQDLQESIDIAHQAGIPDEHIILDPGIGFAKHLQHSLYMMNHLQELVTWGYPVVLGASRKSMIQKTLGRPSSDVIEGTAATTALGIAKGCHIIRVHDVAFMKKVAVMCDAILRQHDC